MVGHGRWFGFGLIPGLLTMALYVAVFIGAAFGVGDFTAWLSPFADDWDSPWRGLFRGLLVVVLFGFGALVAVVAFTAITLVLGQPFYERLSEQVDRSESADGTAPESGNGFARDVWISIRDSVRLLIRVVAWAVLLFVLGFVPVLGQTVVPVIGIGVTGFFLAQELTAVAWQRRGVELREQLAVLRGRRMLAWGFGVPLALVFLIPFVAVLLMPGAVAGATLLVRSLRDENSADGKPLVSEALMAPPR